MPNAPRRVSSLREMKSSTTSASLKFPIMRASRDAIPRSDGASAAARARRASGASGAHCFTTTPNGSLRPLSAKNFSALFMASIERFSHSSLVLAHVVRP